MKKSGKTWFPNIIQHTGHPQAPPNTIPHLLGCSWCGLPRLLHTRLHGERAVERYTASPPPTTPLQSSTALYSLYSFIQLYTALYKDCILYSYTAYTVYSAIQSPSDEHSSILTHRSRYVCKLSGLASHPKSYGHAKPQYWLNSRSTPHFHKGIGRLDRE